jgi:hypothetical protein
MSSLPAAAPAIGAVAGALALTNPLDVLMASVNSNPYFIGLMMLLLNLGGRFLALEISKEQALMLKKYGICLRENELALATTWADAARNAAINFQLQTKLQESEAYGDKLQAIFQKHNLTMLSLKKPGLIEKRMNDATKKLFADITADTTD